MIINLPASPKPARRRRAAAVLAGAQVPETGHLVHAAAPEFAGTIRIQP
jgi:hypothetical protein